MRPRPTRPAGSGRRSARLLACSGAAITALAVAGFAGPASSAARGSHAALPAANKNPITLLFGSSGPPETKADMAAAKAFTKQTGIPVKVTPSANLTQALAQDFAANKPPNLFYLDPTSFQQYAKEGVLSNYGKYLGSRVNGFFPALRSAFTYKGQMYCAPKDASALSLYINTAMWKKAGLTAANYPKNWNQLASAAQKLTTGGVTGLVVDPTESRLDAFLYQAGGSVLNKAGTKVTLNSKANVKALTFLQGMLKNKTMAFPSTLSESDEIPALGDQKAAMIITGPWMGPEMSSEFPKVQYTILPLPTGPTGTKATLSFTNCWGVAANNDNLGGTIKFVKFLTSPAQEIRFAKAFGPIPSLMSAARTYQKLFPKHAEEAKALNFAHPDIAIAGATAALNSFNSALGQLATQSPASILSTAQKNLQAVVNQNKK